MQWCDEATQEKDLNGGNGLNLRRKCDANEMDLRTVLQTGKPFAVRSMNGSIIYQLMEG